MAETDVLDLALRPLSIATSKPAWRAYLGAILFGLASLALFGVALVSYGFFYANYVPRVNVQRAVHLQFGQGHPFGIASLDDSLVSQQSYDVIVHLDLPRSPPNLAAGNFMLDFSLLSKAPARVDEQLDVANVLGRSRRSTLLTYTSPLVDSVLTTASVPWILLGWRREEEQLHVLVMEQVQFVGGSRNTPRFLRLEIQADEKLMIYDARVEFVARFSGLRWMMYNYRIISLLIFSTMFYLTSLASALGVWTLFWTYFPNPSPATAGGASPDGTDHEMLPETSWLKQGRESDLDSPDISDTPRTFPTYARQPPLRYLPTPRATPDREESEVIKSTESQAHVVEADDEDDLIDDFRGGGRIDSGIGTSMEEDSARTVQRRRNLRGGASGGT